MPQMVSIQPVIAQGPPPGTPGKKEQDQFSPHLEKALSSNKSQQQGADGKHLEKTSRSNDQNVSADGESSAPAREGSEALMTIAGEDPGDSLQENPASSGLAYFLEGTARTIPATSIFFNSHQVESITNRLQNASATMTSASHQSEATSIFSRFQQLESAAILPQNTSGVINNIPDNAKTPPGPVAIHSELSSMTTEAEGLNFIKPGVANKQDALLNQLQQIIDSANETGSVAITKATKNSSPHGLRNNMHGLSTALFAITAEPVTASPAGETNDLTLGSLLVAGGDGMEKTAGKPAQNWTGSRQDMQQQYFNAKNTMQNSAENNQNFQNNQQGEEFSQQTMSSGPQSTALGATEPTNTFSQVSATVQPGTAQPVSESPKPILLPSGAIVHEDEVIRQLSERFQISSRHMDSRINIKLHPAELGELKIDLTVKEGSIRANVVAQSQHTLEILEKNIQKLKNMLEQQGFTVEQISLTAESESVGDFDLFDRQLFGKNDYIPNTAKNRRGDGTTFSLADHAIAAPVSNTGVNVKI
jgi:flagellar hook-length control protein FliK